MDVRKDRSIKMPTMYSYYLSNFSNDVYEALKDCKPFSYYHTKLKMYECTKQVFEKIKGLEPVYKNLDYTSNTMEDNYFKRVHDYEYGYQEDAVDFAKVNDSIFLNFPQGMGKSLTTMKIIDALNFRRTLIICGQSNLQEEWIKDAVKHSYAKKINIKIIGGDTGAGSAKRLKDLKSTDQNERVTHLINIEALRNESIVAALNALCYDCIVVDEVQSAKGWKAEQTQGLQELTRPEGQYRISLSGTPVLNNPLEFFSLFKFLGILRDTARTTFEKYYGEWTFDYWGHYICKGYRHLDELAEMLKPVLCYVSKDELHLPPKRRKKVDLPMQDAEQLDQYMKLASIYKMSAKRMAKAGYTSKPSVRAEMRFLSCTAKEKISFVIQQAKKGKVLLFSQYTTVLEVYRDKLVENGLKVLYYYGSLSMSERLDILDKWRTGEYDVLILSIMTARYGLNLTEAATTIFIEPPTSLSILEQAEDRAWRIGQDKEVTSYLLASTSQDEGDLNNIVEKQEALDKLIQLSRGE